MKLYATRETPCMYFLKMNQITQTCYCKAAFKFNISLFDDWAGPSERNFEIRLEIHNNVPLAMPVSFLSPNFSTPS